MQITKVILLITCLFCGVNNSIAQDLAEYMLRAQNAKDDASRMGAMDSILSKTFRKNDTLFIKYSLKYIELAKNNNDIEAAAKKAINLQSVLSHNQQSIKAIAVIYEVLAHKYKIKDSFLLGSLYYRRGRANRTTNIEKAIEDYTLALDNFSLSDTINRADVHLYRGHSNVDAGHYIEGSEDYNTAFRFYEKLKDYEYMLYAQSGKVNMYSMNEFYEEAIIERERYIEKAKELKLLENLPYAYFNQSIDFSKTGSDSLTLANLLLAEEYLPYISSDVGFNVHIEAKFCEYYCRVNNLEKAKFHFDKMHAAELSLETNFSQAIDLYGAEATYFNAIGKFEEALISAKKQQQYARELGHKEEIIDATLILSEIYESLGNYKEALNSKKKYIEVKKQNFNRSNTKSLAYYQSKYVSEKTERDLIEKNANIEILENQNNSFKKQAIFLGVTTILFFGLILLYKAKQEHKNKKILQERFSQDLIVSQENERIRISKDLHDGLGQRLLVIKNKLLSSGDTESVNMLNATIEEVRAITRDLHPFQLQELGITKAIEHTISEVDENTNLFISAEIENIDNLFNKEQEVNIYRIIQEALSNIVKHSKAEATKITIKKSTNTVLISIRDNGIGFEFQDRLHDKKTLGLNTLLERTKSLKGQMKIQSKKENGTLLEFQFPV